MKVYSHSDKLNASKKKHTAKSTGLVPTMGVLHEGHITLVKKALSENELVIVSIFVNPTQFDNSDDLKNYPKTLKSDILKLKSLNSNIWIYAPEVSDLYDSFVEPKLYDFGSLETVMEGSHRKGHFQGVATIVEKLFRVLKPSSAYFGEKDFQQLLIIKALVEYKKIPVTIVSCPIIRHEDGLAMSSRNKHLSSIQRAIAPIIYETLLKAVELKGKSTPDQIGLWINDFFKHQSGIELEYFNIANEESLEKISNIKDAKARAFIALKLGQIRLIDNIKF
tara:strand:- start:6 stop:842 length:837 start_codon:yes stop_codon:yes gene_type:complete